MRNFEGPGRSMVMAVNGMAATSHPLSTLTAVDVLQAGGNAVDAAVAACAVQCVVEPGSTGIGGDCFALLAMGGRPPILAFNGSGRAPRAASREALVAAGLTAIPRQSPHAVTIPGAVDAWSQLLAKHGTRGLGEVLKPAIRLARDGYAISPRVHLDWCEQVEVLKADPAARRMLLVDDAAPRPGTRHRQPELAATLEAIARDGRDAFYSGPIAADMVERLQAAGGAHTLEDFATAEGEYVEPIRSEFRGYDVYECPPNGQGITALILLNVLSGIEAKGDPLGLERLHREIEATRLAYAVRDTYVADPAKAEVPVDWLLSERLAFGLRQRITPGKVLDPLPAVLPPTHSDTVYITVVDKDRNAVSFINSTFNTFGSGIMAPRTGIVLQNRGQGFSLTEGHLNALAGAKRPMHTIIPGMLVEKGRAVMPFGVMGGQYQAMGHAYFLTRVLDYGLDLQSAMDLPRLFPEPGTRTVTIERRMPREVHEGLARLGYQLNVPSRPLGGSQAIRIDWEHGVLTGASDPRKDGCAMGY